KTFSINQAHVGSCSLFHLLFPFQMRKQREASAPDGPGRDDAEEEVRGSKRPRSGSFSIDDRLYQAQVRGFQRPHLRRPPPRARRCPALLSHFRMISSVFISAIAVVMSRACSARVRVLPLTRVFSRLSSCTRVLNSPLLWQSMMRFWSASRAALVHSWARR